MSDFPIALGLEPKLVRVFSRTAYEPTELPPAAYIRYYYNNNVFVDADLSSGNGSTVPDMTDRDRIAAESIRSKPLITLQKISLHHLKLS
jgi:hypothetical protein